MLIPFGLGPPAALAETLVVDQGGSGEFLNIRGAVNSAEAGDEIRILPGYYREGEIPISRPVSIAGTRGQVTLEGGFKVEASCCNISGIDFVGAGRGIGVEVNSSKTSIEDCTIGNFSTGVHSAYSNALVVDSAIEGCSVGVRLLEGSDDGIIDTRILSAIGVEVVGCRGSAIKNCTISGDSGVQIRNSSCCIVNGSVFVTRTGVEISDSEGNTIGGNNLSSMEMGVVIEGSESNEILDNVVSGAVIVGFILLGSENNSVFNNSARRCNVGIRLKDSTYNLLGSNRLEENEVAGILLEGSENNEIKGNFFIENVEGLILRSGSVENNIEDNQIIRNELGLSILGSGSNLLRGNRMVLNRYAVRVDREDPSSLDDGPFRQDADPSNTIDDRPVCYLIDGRDLSVSGEYGFLALVGCDNVTAENLILSNNSAGALLVNSTGCAANNLTLSGDEAGVRMLKTTDCRVEECGAENCTVGFMVLAGIGDDLMGCTARGSSEAGFDVQDSTGATLRGANASEGKLGIAITNSSSSTIIQSEVRGNADDGIRLIRSPDSLLNMNLAADNLRGISVSGSEGAMVIRSELSRNQEAGLVLDQLSGATVAGNLAIENGDGIFLQSVEGAKIEGNNMSRNGRYGLRMSFSRDGKVTGNYFIQNGLGGANLIDCTGCRVYHNNFIDNGILMLSNNAVDNGDNEWDAGSKVGGNFWSDHRVLGNPGSDPKAVPTKGTDRYPFQDSDGWK